MSASLRPSPYLCSSTMQIRWKNVPHDQGQGAKKNGLAVLERAISLSPRLKGGRKNFALQRWDRNNSVLILTLVM